MQLDRLSVSTIRDVLSFISPNCSRDEWWEIAAALKSELGDDGFDLFDGWSQLDGPYNARDTRDTWKSTRAHGGIGIGTLVKRAQDAGFVFGAGHHEITEEERQQRERERLARAQREAAETARKHARAAKAAAEMWAASTPAESHPYCERKRIAVPNGVRVGEWVRWVGDEEVSISDTLLIPMFSDDGVLCSLQGIFPDSDNPLERDRDYLPGGAKGWMMLGQVTDDVVMIGEGFATCCSSSQATAHASVVAFDAGRLPEVALAIRKRYPTARIIMLADDDRFTFDAQGNPRNAGIKYATKAAALVGGVVCAPVFKSDEKKPTDWNDLHVIEGLPEVRRQIMAVIKPAKADAPPPVAPPTPANDNTPEGALAAHIVVHGLSPDGTLYYWDVKTEKMGGVKTRSLCSKAALLSLAPVTAWDLAVGSVDPSRSKFSVDAAFGLLMEIAKGKPEYKPPKAKTQAGQLTGVHGADSAVIAGVMRETTLFDEYSQNWYSWDTIWRPITEGDVNRRLITLLDHAFNCQYEISAFNGTFNLLKKRLGRSPELTDDGAAAFDAWNSDRDLLPMRNGVLRLSTGRLVEHAPEMMMPWLIPHDYDPEADCPATQKFLTELSQGDVGVEEVLYAFLSAVLHGRADLQKYLECVGIAGTGKSTYIKLCQELVGGRNVAVTTMQALNQNQFETANLYGKRLVVISDADKYGGTVDIFKAITGQDPVRYEEKHKQAGRPFIFGGMVICAANQPIQFSDTSTAMVRRRVPVHLDKRLDESKVDADLSSKLRAEIPGLINVLLRSSQEQITAILRDTDSSRIDATLRAMCETNPIAAWLNDQCVRSESLRAKVGTLKNSPAECLYPNYAMWSEKTGRKGVVGLHGFSRAILDVLSFAKVPAEKVTTDKGAHITGMRLRGDMDDHLPPLLFGEKPESMVRFE